MRRTSDYAWREIERLHEEFEHDLLLLKQGLYPPDIRVAQLSLQAHEDRDTEHRIRPAHHVTNPLHVLVVLNVVPVLSPRPRVINGELLESHFDIDTPSRSALQHAVELKSASDNVTVTAIAAAPQFAAESLLRALALGADNAALIKTDDLLDSPHDAARLIADLAGQKQLPCDLVLCGDAVLAAVLAGNLGQAYFSNVKDFVITGDQTKVTLQKPDASIATDGPVVLAMADSTADIDFTRRRLSRRVDQASRNRRRHATRHRAAVRTALPIARETAGRRKHGNNARCSCRFGAENRRG